MNTDPNKIEQQPEQRGADCEKQHHFECAIEHHSGEQKRLIQQSENSEHDQNDPSSTPRFGIADNFAPERFRYSFGHR